MADLLNLEEIAALTGLDIPEDEQDLTQVSAEASEDEESFVQERNHSSDSEGLGDNASSADLSQSFKHYNFSAEDYSLKKLQPAFEYIYNHFKQDYQSVLSQTVRKPFSVEYTGIKSQTFQELLSAQPSYSGFNLIQCPQLQGQIYLLFDLALMQRLVELYFGSKSFSATCLERDFTSSELRLMKNLTEQACEQLSSSWKGVHELSLSLAKTETQTQFVTDFPANEIFCLAQFNIECNEYLGSIFIALPMSLVEPIKEKLIHIDGLDMLPRDEAWVGQFQNNVLGSKIPLSAQLQALQVNVSDVVSLKTGDVIQIDNAQDIILSINDKPMLLGAIAERDQQKVVQIRSWIQ